MKILWVVELPTNENVLIQEMNEESVDLNSNEFDDQTFIPSTEEQVEWQKNLISLYGKYF